MSDFQLLVEHARRAICVVDGEWLVTYANPAFVILFGEPAGCSLLDLVDPAHRGLVGRAADDLAGEPLEFRLVDSGRWIEADLSYVPDAGLVLELRETTDHRRLSDAMTRSYLLEREAAVRNRELQELRAGLLAAVSHDFRTPLTSIVGFTGLLREHWERFNDEARLDLVARLERAADQLDRRVTDFLEISRLDAGPVELDTMPIDLVAVVASAVERNEMVLDGRTVEVELPDALVVLADEEAAGRVLDNLLGNAAKYSPPHSSIVVTADEVEGFARLFVLDEGPGVELEDRELVFEPFVRANSTRKLSRGAGVGLTAVRRLVEAQGGAVWIADSPRGARFTVALPLAGTHAHRPELQEVVG